VQTARLAESFKLLTRSVEHTGLRNSPAKPRAIQLFLRKLLQLTWLRKCEHKGNEIWLLNSMEILMHSKKSFSTKVSKEILPFQQDFPI